MNGIVSKLYDKRDDFNSEIVNFSFLDGDDLWCIYLASYSYFKSLNVSDFNTETICDFLLIKTRLQI